MKPTMLILVLCCFAFAACSSEVTEVSTAPTTSATSSTATTPTSRPLADLVDKSGADRVYDRLTTKLEVGETVVADLDSHCGFSHLPTIGGTQWEAPELRGTPNNATPTEWGPEIYQADYDVDLLTVTMERTSEDELLVTALNTQRTVTYNPAGVNRDCE